MFITSAQKWHISGKIIDANPEPERAPVDYFERLEAQRKAELIRQFQADDEAMARALSEKKNTSSPPVARSKLTYAEKVKKVQMYKIGMFFQILGVYILLRSIFL